MQKSFRAHLTLAFALVVLVPPTLAIVPAIVRADNFAAHKQTPIVNAPPPASVQERGAAVAATTAAHAPTATPTYVETATALPAEAAPHEAAPLEVAVLITLTAPTATPTMVPTATPPPNAATRVVYAAVPHGGAAPLARPVTTSLGPNTVAVVAPEPTATALPPTALPPTAVPPTATPAAVAAAPLPEQAQATGALPGHGRPGQTWKTISPGYYEQTNLPVRGISTYYNPGVMDRVLSYRFRMGDITPCPECVGYVALVREGDLNRRIWIQVDEDTVEGPFLVADCAHTYDVPRLLNIGWGVDLDYQTAKRWDFKMRTVTILDAPPIGWTQTLATLGGPAADSLALANP